MTLTDAMNGQLVELQGFCPLSAFSKHPGTLPFADHLNTGNQYLTSLYSSDVQVPLEAFVSLPPFNPHNVTILYRKQAQRVTTATTEPAQTGPIPFLTRPRTKVQTLDTPLTRDSYEPLTVPPTKPQDQNMTGT